MSRTLKKKFMSGGSNDLDIFDQYIIVQGLNALVSFFT